VDDRARRAAGGRPGPGGLRHRRGPAPAGEGLRPGDRLVGLATTPGRHPRRRQGVVDLRGARPVSRRRWRWPIRPRRATCRPPTISGCAAWWIARGTRSSAG
jgi:hypothetical protein